jgi:hypothetical protein
VEPLRAVAPVERRDRHSAMGLDVPPVHGWHCICERCQRQARGQE